MTAKHEPLAAACLLASFRGHTAPDWIRRRIERGLGGVVLFAGNVRDREQLAELTAALRGEREDVVVALDEEGGDVTRLEAATGSSYPGNRALGVVDDVALTKRVASALGGELAEVGVNLDLAPVGDLASDPASPIVGVRSFGADAELVARHVRAFVRGLQGAGVAACVKHFPGHGATALDSHLELPTVEKSASELLAEDLRPFRAAIDAGVRAVMTGHLRVPALDRGAPAVTVSRPILHDFLRDRLGFDGMVVTDALDMRAVSATLGVERVAPVAVWSGADALCLGPQLGRDEVDGVARAIREAMRRGFLGEERLHEAGARVRAAAEKRSDGRREDRGVGREAARLAVRAEGTIRLVRPPFVVDLRPEANIAAGSHAHGLADALDGSVSVRLAAPREVAVPPGRQLVLVVRDAHRYAWERELAAGLVAGAPDAIVVETGLPVWRPQAAGYVATNGAGRVNLEAAAELLGQQAST